MIRFPDPDDFVFDSSPGKNRNSIFPKNTEERPDSNLNAVSVVSLEEQCLTIKGWLREALLALDESRAEVFMCTYLLKYKKA